MGIILDTASPFSLVFQVFYAAALVRKASTCVASLPADFQAFCPPVEGGYELVVAVRAGGADK